MLFKFVRSFFLSSYKTKDKKEIRNLHVIEALAINPCNVIITTNTTEHKNADMDAA